MKTYKILMILFFGCIVLASAKEKENNATQVFGLAIDHDGYFSVPKEGKPTVDSQKQELLIKKYELQQQNFIKEQEEKLKKLQQYR
jgi:hypothetical protein